MPILASDALVLRTYKLGETSKVVVLLSRSLGKLRAVAKGARGPRSRYQSALEPLSEVRVTLYGRQGTELYRLGACELLHSAFPLMSRGVEEGLALPYFAELLDAFAQEGDAEDAVYRLAGAVLRAGDEGVPVKLLARYLEAWLLRLHGIYPPLDRCSNCRAPLPPGPLRYHAPARGFVCGPCVPAGGPLFDERVRAALEALFKRAPAALTGELLPGVAPLESFHHELIAAHLERNLHSTRVLRDVAREGR
jgi:DNA repair protein RecO (recombination protein O)